MLCLSMITSKPTEVIYEENGDRMEKIVWEKEGIDCDHVKVER